MFIQRHLTHSILVMAVWGLLGNGLAYGTQPPCYKEEKKLEKADGKLTKALDRRDQTAEKYLNMILRWQLKIADYTGQVNLYNELKDNCTDPRVLLLGIFLGGKKFKFSSIVSCRGTAQKMIFKYQSKRDAAIQKKVATEGKRDIAMERRTERVNLATAAKDAAQAALQQCLNPPPNP